MCRVRIFVAQKTTTNSLGQQREARKKCKFLYTLVIHTLSVYAACVHVFSSQQLSIKKTRIHEKKRMSTYIASHQRESMN